MKSQISALVAVAVVSGTALPAIAADTKSSYDQLEVQSGRTKAAASDIFRAAPADTALSKTQRTMLDLAKTSRATTGVKVVAGPTAQMLEEGLTKGAHTPSASAKITLALSDNTILTAARTRVDVGPDASIWRGTIEHSGGQVTLMWWPDGQIAGTVQHEGHFYSIRPMGDSMHAIVDMSADLMPPDHAPLMLVSSNDLFGKPRVASSLMPVTGGMRLLSAERHETQTATRQPGSSLSVPTKDVTIDVLVAYTKKAAGYYSDVRRELVDLAIEEANESFRRSNVGQVKLRLVHAYQTDYVEEGGHFDHVWRLADKGDGYLEEVHALRDKYRADVVVLIVDDPQGCGLSTRVHADANEAYAVVHHECAATTYSLAHEIGHIIGARHDLNMDQSMTPFPYGHGYVNGTKWRDIMSYKESCGGCPRVAVWSSPTVLVNGEPAGTTEQDNARVIAEEAIRVAAFR